MEAERIVIEPLSAQAFAPFGQVIAAHGAPDRLINDDRCGRWHDRARIDVEGRVGLSVFDSQAVALPYRFALVERHPLGSQAFVPMTQNPFLAIVAPDEGGRPGRPRAFITAPGEGVNLDRGVWHGVLAPLAEPGLFAVIDRVSAGANLELFTYPRPWVATP